MIAMQQKTSLMLEEKAFLRTLLYFDIFNYPLTENEIEKYAHCKVALRAGEILNQLLDQKLIFKVGEFYSIQKKAELSARRINGNNLAEQRLTAARKFSKIIARFPFVRAVLLSGSISKGVMDEKSDIDYFIITAPNRLWIVRSALVLFRRIFLFNSRKNFCTNYFIDTNNLSIPDHNYFTAIEYCTLVPMYGQEQIQEFHFSNQWVKSFLPACQKREPLLMDSNFEFKNFLEKVLSGKLFTKLNSYLMKTTLKYWKKKYAGSLDQNDFDIAFRSKPGVSRSHPQFFQKKVLDRLSQKVKEFESQHEIDLTI